LNPMSVVNLNNTIAINPWNPAFHIQVIVQRLGRVMSQPLQLLDEILLRVGHVVWFVQVLLDCVHSTNEVIVQNWESLRIESRETATKNSGTNFFRGLQQFNNFSPHSSHVRPRVTWKLGNKISYRKSPSLRGSRGILRRMITEKVEVQVSSSRDFGPSLFHSLFSRGIMENKLSYR
jgi:hypothetical protein